MATMLLCLALLGSVGEAQRCVFTWDNAEVNTESAAVLRYEGYAKLLEISEIELWLSSEYEIENLASTKVSFGSPSSQASNVLIEAETAGDYYVISLTNFENQGSTEVATYEFFFNLKGPPYVNTIDLSTSSCHVYDVDGNEMADYEITTVYNLIAGTGQEIEVSPSTSAEPMTMVFDDLAPGVTSTLTLTYTTSQTLQDTTWYYLSVPKANLVYQSETGVTARSLITEDMLSAGDTSVFAFNWEQDDGTGETSPTMSAITYIYEEGTDFDPDIMAFKFETAPTEEFDPIVIVANFKTAQNMPVETELSTDWEFSIMAYTGADTVTSISQLNKVESASDPDTWLYTEGFRTDSNSNEVTVAATQNGVGVSDATYTFQVLHQNAFPATTKIIITYASAITIPDEALTFACVSSSGCASSPTVTVDVDAYTVTIEEFTDGYQEGSQSIFFSLAGWTNAADSNEYSFSIEAYYVDGSTDYKIESFSGYALTATEGECTIYDVYMVDDDTRIYAQVNAMFVQMKCNHALLTTYGIKLAMPSDFIVKDRSSCTFTGYQSSYLCRTIAEDNEIEITDFLDDDIEAGTLIEFTIDSIISPATFDASGTIYVSTIEEAGGVQIDIGSWSFDSGYFTAGNITSFKVDEQDNGVGEYPVKYDFSITPNGELPIGAYMVLELPPSIEIIDDNDFENDCGIDLYAFTNDAFNCQVGSDLTTIKIIGGFQYQATTNLTDDDGSYNPPELIFTLDGFSNPREGLTTEPWNVTIYNSRDKVIYYWWTEDSPTQYFSGVSQPQYIMPTQENYINGAFSWLEFTVITTGGLSEGDKIVVNLPFGWQFSQASEAYGRDTALSNVFERTISVDQRSIEITMELNENYKRRLTATEEAGWSERSLQSIENGLGFAFRITNMKNRNSFRPADESIEYFVYSSAGVLFEEKTSDLMLVNNQTGELSAIKNGIIPGDFRSDFETNYTLSLQVANFEKNMVVELSLPDEIDFGDEDPTCLGLSGTDNENLVCDTDREAKTLTFTNAMQFSEANPGEMVILIENFKNPSVNVETSTFKIRTMTFDLYDMDLLTANMTVNFYCEYPCASCPEGQPSTCDTCYQTATERYFFEAKCLSECPDTYTEADDLTCASCESPCVTCEGAVDYCTQCEEGYYVIEGGKCREEVIWYFPFLASAIFFFLLILISEIVTKRASNFKESIIAFWSLPEVGSWGLLIYMMWERQGQSYASALAALAALFYFLINMVHMIFHPRYMVPNTLYSYKQLLTDYKCGTFMARAVSYLVSFKFSLILVSYFFNSPRLKGDYSAMNWKHFNRFSMIFICLPYASMMASCIYFILTDGFWSYPGFVASEVIVLSSIMTILLAIDALSAIKCKTVGKRKTNKAIRVATGADYESDEDEMQLKQKVLKQKTTKSKNAVQDDFGVDESEYGSEVDSVTELKNQRHGMSKKTLGRPESENSFRSQLSQQTQVMNEEARKQIAMLEELAHQMREEKRQLQLDKDRIEREKMNLNEERIRSQHNMESYMNDAQRQTTALSNQVREMEKQKMQLVQQVEEKLDEGNRVNQILAQKVHEANNQRQILANQQIRKNFRDFEGEMEDYEPVEEENSEDAQSSVAEVVDAAQLPVLPANGQIDYYRHMEGEAQHWMQQITPRAGGDSMLGQHDMEDDMELQMEKNQTAHYEVASVPPSRYDDQMENGVVDAEFQEMTSQMEVCQSEEYQQRSDAEMEVNSEREEKEAVEQQYFEPERAIFSQLQDRDEKESNAEYFSNVVNPVFEQLEKPPTRHGVEQLHFVPIEPQKGEGDKQGEMNGSTTHFFKQEAPHYGEVLEEGEMERQATAQHFFNPERATQGDADDAARSGLATPMEYIERQSNVYGRDVEDPNMREAIEQRHFNQEPAVKDDVSNMGRSILGSEMVYQEREEALIGKDLDGDRVREGTEQQFFNREEAMYSQDKSMGGKNATDVEFFKQDEALRGDITSQDKSVTATQHQYFNNLDQPDMGRPDSYSRLKSDNQQEFINKSEIGDKSAQGRNNRGIATPYTDKMADPVDYLNKSEAEYGRQSTVQERDASQHKYFEQEKNPEFGRGEDFSRQREQEHEYNPTPVQDSSGVSEESSEGGIADHQPFTSGVNQHNQKLAQFGMGGADPNVEQVKKVLQQNPNAKRFEEDQRMLRQEAPDAAPITSPQKNRASMKQHPNGPGAAKAKTILYSDKSETSVEDLMDDTPSNYNIQNGRFEGKSLGLKALLLHAKSYKNQTLDPNGNPTPQPESLGLAGLADQQNRSPQHSRPGQGMLAPGLAGAQKGIIGSQNDERQFVKNLHATGNSIGAASSNNQWRAGGPMGASRVPVIGEESSANGDAMHQRNTRNQVRTNKQFVEDPRMMHAAAARGGYGRGGGIPTGARSPNVASNGRGAPKITKNNYFGGQGAT